MAGDETGIATVVLDLSRIISRNNVISISRARIFLFHGIIKQIQNTDKGENVSIVKELDVEMEVDEDGFNLSEKRRGERPYRTRRGRKESDEEEPQHARTDERKPRERGEPTRPTRRDRCDSDEEPEKVEQT